MQILRELHQQNYYPKKGYSVIIIEKNEFPRNKPCGGGLTKRLLEEFPFVNDPTLIESYSYSGILHSPSLKYEIKVDKDEPLVGMVIRKKFDFKLLQLALNEGAVLVENKKVTDIKIRKHRAEILLDNNDVIKSKILIGADGVWSTVAKKTGLRNKLADYGVCIVEEFRVEEKVIDEFFGKSRLCHIFSQPEKINGYGWVFPKKEHLNIGIGKFASREKQVGKNLLEIFMKYMNVLKKNDVIPKSIKVTNYKGAVLPIIPLDKTYCNRVILLGDAAGFASASTGEGLYYAMKSAKLATEVIERALKMNNLSKDFFSRYQKLWKKDFGKDLTLFYKNRKKQNQLGDKFLKIVDSDKVLTDMILELGLGSLSLQECKWKLFTRFLYSSLKYKINKG